MHHKPQENTALPPTPVPHRADTYLRSNRRRGGRKSVHISAEVGNKSRKFLGLVQNNTRVLN